MQGERPASQFPNLNQSAAMSFANYSPRRAVHFALPASIFTVSPDVTETKFRNFEKKITAARAEIHARLSGQSASVKAAAVVNELSETVYNFMVKDHPNPFSRGRKPFRISEFEKTKIGFYAQFLTRSAVSDVMEICSASVKRYEQEYAFPVVE